MSNIKNPFTNLDEYANQLKEIERIELVHAFRRKNSTSKKGVDIKGSIYVLRSIHTENVYIGCTTRSLKTRLSSHKSDYKSYLKDGRCKYYSSFEILALGDCEIIEVESFYGCFGSLIKLEGKHIKQTANSVNIINRRK